MTANNSEPEGHVFEAEQGRFVLADGSDPLAVVAAMTIMDRSRVDHLEGESPEQNRARLEELGKKLVIGPQASRPTSGALRCVWRVLTTGSS